MRYLECKKTAGHFGKYLAGYVVYSRGIMDRAEASYSWGMNGLLVTSGRYP